MAKPVYDAGSATSNVPAANNNNIMRALIERRKKLWLRWFIAILVSCILYGLFAYPQTFTSKVSIAVQGSSPTSSIAGLLSMSSMTHKYTGALKSRSFAEQAEKVSHLKELYELKRPSDVMDKYASCVKFDDNAADGLIYITVSLDAPPILIPNTGARREEVRNAAAVVANTYYKSLIHYLEYVDSDKELVLLRSANAEVVKARNDYELAMNRLVRFVRSNKIRPTAPPTIPQPGQIVNGTPPSGSTDTSAAATQFLALFSKKAQLEAEITAAKTLHERLKALLARPLSIVSAIPGEDPLLFEARHAYNEAYRNWQTLNAQFGPDNPRLASAKSIVDIARQRLKSEILAVLRGDTTENMNLVTLESTYATVSRQVADAERNFNISRGLTTDLGRLSSEVALNLKVLETAKTAAETLKLTTVAARNRANLVDDAQPEERSHPGKGMLIAVSILISCVVIGAWCAIEYNLALKQRDSPSNT